MNVLYIGLYGDGETSKMRGETLKRILSPYYFKVIDIQKIFRNANKIFRSLSFRFQIGPVIYSINSMILKELKEDTFDLIWIDKATLLTENTTKILKSRTKLLVHFTPDCAFYSGYKSKLFNKSIKYYDKLITTKSFEIQYYLKFVDISKLILTTQAFDSNIHKSIIDFNEKKGVAFVGLFEKERGTIIKKIIDAGIHVKLAGKNWDRFVKENEKSSFLEYYGNKIYGDSYAKLMSSSLFGLGLLSKRFPELHTTRTFEIPACGTVLITEKNSEIESYFSTNEVLYFKNYDEIISLINHYNNNITELKKIIDNSKKCIYRFDYNYTIKKILVDLDVKINMI